MKAGPNTKKWLKGLAKILGSAFCLYWLFTQIEWGSVKEKLWEISPVALILSTAFCVASHLISVKRLEVHFKVERIYVSFHRNLRLYMLAMFYSLFLPGIIGGDGYKMYWLKQEKDVALKTSFRTLLIDRLNGLWALLFLAGILTLFIEIEIPGKIPLLVIGLGALYLVAYVVVDRFFQPYKRVLFPASLLSLCIQMCLLICIFCLLWGYGQTDNYMSYGLIFFLGALASVIPISIGGLGFRELVFLYGASYFQLDQDLAVSVSLLFYLITVLISLLGVIELWRK